MQIDNLEISFSDIYHAVRPGETFQQLFDRVRLETKRLKEKLLAETGGTMLTEEWCDKLTEEEREILQLNQWFKGMAEAK